MATDSHPPPPDYVLVDEAPAPSQVLTTVTKKFTERIARVHAEERANLKSEYDAAIAEINAREQRDLRMFYHQASVAINSLVEQKPEPAAPGFMQRILRLLNRE